MLDKELLTAARLGNAAEISALVERGAQADARDETGATALLIATDRKSVV